MPSGFPWGMPPNFVLEGYQPEVPVTQLVMYVPTPVVHVVPLCRKIQALRGKDLFGKNVHDLCFVTNVKIPHKFKVLDFEKYKVNSRPLSHLLMYARKVSTQTNNHQLMIHYFQDSLTGAALKWYMGLDNTQIRTFNDLGEAFVRQYKYNVDMVPDRDQLCAISRKDKETFKEHAQRWRGIAEVSPPLEEKEMTNLFLKTFSPFYYDRMVASMPNDFIEMVNMGLRLEKGVRERRLKEGISSDGSRMYGNGLSKKKEHDANTFSVSN
ncbi:uncharacterized protein LOC127081488 [Lathyrus oleraceus]|uniref:uncharacterized protein LOC127081488 n=1 Tax=Pisum sativum TaxID=3888 RepID=UPI0021D0E2F5|nr:uncharacterized protein LOC127081488 [Pisum sativum]